MFIIFWRVPLPRVEMIWQLRFLEPRVGMAFEERESVRRKAGKQWRILEQISLAGQTVAQMRPRTIKITIMIRASPTPLLGP